MKRSSAARPLVTCLLAGLLLVACGQGSDGEPLPDGSSGAGAPGDNAGPVPLSDAPSPRPGASGPPDGVLDDDASLRRLESRVATDVVDALEHDSWTCTGGTWSIEYRFVIEADGTRVGAELDGDGTVTSTTFAWAAIGADTLLLDYPDVGRQVELGSILFADDDALRANDGENGPLECRRQRYVGGEPTREISITAAGDVDRDVEAAVALAERIETRRGDDGVFDHWLCETVGEGTTGYVFAGPGVLDPEPHAVTFDIAPGDAPGDGDGGETGSRRPVDEATLAGGRTFLWLATDGTTLVLVPLDTDVASASAGFETLSLDAIVFPVDDAFTARRTDGALLQCLRDGDGG